MDWNSRAITLVPLIFKLVMDIQSRLPDLKGADKKAALLVILGSVLELTEGATGRDLVNNADFLNAVGATVDAVVALHKVVTEITAKPVAPAA